MTKQTFEEALQEERFRTEVVKSVDLLLKN